MKHAFWALTLIAGITACSNNSDSDGNSDDDTGSPALLNAD
ncbi:Uncharacterised protein [BD1-7 clade bacterium]|uniref:Uncharacterized protein n=1 Tax=BD1-7 clade bacterium TaxID=2029982 RepID=A0A5S9P2Z0_9GAMM|nr:Uncharacterised protein [BD1-7 clade bacterium]CAA0109925.1 Uncharacterised protein [BD1-7 clade bacterium]CAA0116637.1 Uncharacterised protein [BD1-7 clade bacterium]